MRVTSSMQNTQLLRNLRNINSDLTGVQNQLSTGQRISRPSDDPVGIGYQMRYDTDLSRSDEYLSNINTGIGMLNTMDSLMQQASDVLKRARTLAQQGATGTTPLQGRLSIAAEVKQLKEQLVQIGNSTYNGRYLFNGQKTDQPPYTVNNAANNTTDSGVFSLSVSPSMQVPVSISGETIFGQSGTQNAFKVLDDIITSLQNPVDATAESQLSNSLTQIDTTVDHMMISWAEIGARTNRFELMQNRIEDDKVSLQKQRSGVADVDMAGAITKMQLKQNVLQAALSTGAQLLKTSLVDFLR